MAIEDDQMGYSLIDNDFSSIYDMTDDEIKECIVEDLLDLEFSKNEYDCLTEDLLFRFIDHDDFLNAYVRSLFNDILSTGLILKNDDCTITIPEDKYQDAMDYCGVWFEGYKPKDNTITIGLSDESKQLIRAIGFDKFVDLVASDIIAQMNHHDESDKPTIINDTQLCHYLKEDNIANLNVFRTQCGYYRKTTLNSDAIKNTPCPYCNRNIKIF